ncbi:Recombination RecR [Gossypium arboreum]|uniref:Recombination RecR n=1 Tax=Gossypium arboreum TaxID=29729 RepID=A0A0B0N9S4_GOSAR|nr:Recombination RecR [Gossypium arboreum]
MSRRRLRDLIIIQNPPNSKETNSEQQTAIGSSNVLNTADEATEIQTESGWRRKTRGRTLLKYLYELNSVKHVKVARNSHGQPIGSEARLLAGYLGIIARNPNLLPINYKSWHHMSDRNKNQALDNIKERFALEELSSGQKVGRLQLFYVTHKKKDGSPITTEAAEIMEKLKDKMAEYEAIASSDSSVNLDDIHNRIITEVLGPKRYGRVRFQGSFVNPTQYVGSNSQQYIPLGNQAQPEVQRLRDQMAQMQASTVEQIAQLKEEAASREAKAQRKYKELQLKLKAEAAAKEAKASRKYDKLQLQLQNMIKLFQQSQNLPS